MALHLFMNDLILSQGQCGISFDIMVVDDNARSLTQKPKDALLAHKQEQDESITNRWGAGLVRQDSDPCIISPKINTIDDSSSPCKNSTPLVRRAPLKTKSDSTLTIPQRVASPCIQQRNRKITRAHIKIVEDSTSRSSPSSCCQVPPQLPRRVESPYALKDKKSSSRTVPKGSNQSHVSGSIAIRLDLIMEDGPTHPAGYHDVLKKQDHRYSNRSRRTQKDLPSRLLGLPYTR